MMGRHDRDQKQLFYSFCLDEAVPDDHLFARSLRLLICRGSMPRWRAITPILVALRSIRC
jgi:hypothetical protein